MKRTALTRKTPMKKRNGKRHAREFARTFGEPERVAIVQSLPCAACGVEGCSVNAHIGDEGSGAGRRANADQIAPLCDTVRRQLRGIAGPGCHQLFDESPTKFWASFPSFNVADVCEETDRVCRERLEGAA